MKRAVIITAGGIGSRMKQNTPKQFLELGSIPILMITLKAFHCFDSSMIIAVTLPDHLILEWENLTDIHEFKIPHKIVAGGETRFHSIKNALPQVQSSDFVAIHDAVRPFVSQKMIDDAFMSAQLYNSAIPINPVSDSIRVKKDDYPFQVERSLVFSVQTPQCFQTQKITEAYNIGYKNDYTDDGSVYENSIGNLSFYEGIPENIKITNPSDLIVAKALFNHLQNDSSFPQFGENWEEIL